MSRSVVVLGGSVGGTRVARTLRASGYDGRVVIVEAESHLPYDKPPLSKEALRAGAPTMVPLLTQSEAEDLAIELVLGTRAVALDPGRSEVTLSDGTVLSFDDVVIATGAAARPSPWGQLPGVHVIRSLDDAVSLRDHLDRGSSMVVVGAGFIGSEVASVARERGLEVTLVDPVPVPLGRRLGPALGQRLVDLQRAHGVDVRCGVGVTGIEETPDGLRVGLGDGSHVEADVVVVGIGVRLNTDWLEGSGLVVDDGVVADEFSRAIGYERVHVVGDIARWHHRRHDRSVRVEHWTNAVDQADRVAKNIAHPEQALPYEPVEYVWSDQYDWRIQILGVPTPDADPVMVEQTDPFRLVAVWADAADHVTGGLTVNWPKASLLVRRGIAAGASATELAQSVGTAVAR